MNRQKLHSQKGEIAFRKELYKQQVEKKIVFDDEYDAHALEAILKERMNGTLRCMTALKERGIPLSPYVELGAERCQRSLVMENDFQCNGAAVDISHDMLKSCDYYKKLFHKEKAPMRICCDANVLPFKSNSVPFIFCYQTLHHFPDPEPVTREIYRVLSPGGCFFFDEEPVKQVLHINLYKGEKIYSKKSLMKGKIHKIFDFFFSSDRCNEVEFGIVENHDISIRSWIRALQCYDTKEATIDIPGGFRFPLFRRGSYIRHCAAWLLGGKISGLCKKRGEISGQYCSTDDMVVCASCVENGEEIPLENCESSYHCPRCLQSYPVIDGVVMLLSREKMKDLYPKMVGSVR